VSGSAGAAIAVSATARQSVLAVRDDAPLAKPSGGIDAVKPDVVGMLADSAITTVVAAAARKT
jgi:hypothetical protein